MRRYLLLSLFSLISFFTVGQRGKDGAKTVSTTNAIVNEYTTLIADAAAGSNNIIVSNSVLNSNGYFSAALNTGDLIFIIQLQGASITNPNDATYGTITSYNNAGNNEFAEVASVSGSTITLNCALKNNYTASGKVQVIRVPRYSTLTINAGASMTCPVWNGSVGGVVVVEVLNTTTVNGAIDASSKGFRGGQKDNDASFGYLDYRLSSTSAGAEKGEGIAGYQGDYDAIGGRYCRGAPANGGGGGDAHNGGGGGGANSGNVATWNGNGNPDISNSNYITAWNLESPGFANNVSSGGGRGGYDYNSNKANPLIYGPDNGVWGGDNRKNNGGMGGHPLDYSSGRLFLGGGGGAGDQNENKGGVGGNGGGLIYLRTYTDVTGSGSIIANGQNGFPTAPSLGTDGAGGAGGGGTIIVNSTGNIVSTLFLSVTGGNGGNQTVYDVFREPSQAEGPGGGGGGGYIGISNGSPGRSAAAGINGVTNSGSMGSFPMNGATKGGNGNALGSSPAFSVSANNTTACSGGTATLTANITGTLPMGSTIVWYSSATGGTPLGTGNTFTTPSLSAPATYYVGTCPGTYRVAVNVTLGGINSSFTASNACIGTTVSFAPALTGAASYSWSFDDGNISASPSPTNIFYVAKTYNVSLKVTDISGCSSTTTLPLVIFPAPTVSFIADEIEACDSLQVTFTNNTTGASTYEWKFGDGLTSTAFEPKHTYYPGFYSVTLIASEGSCSSSYTAGGLITITETPKATINSSATILCLNDCVNFTSTITGNASDWTWNFEGAATPISSSPNPSGICYPNHGKFDVKLTVAEGNCSSSQTLADFVSVKDCSKPVANFATNVTGICNGTCINFHNLSLNGSSYSWTFHGATPSSSTDLDPSNICYDNAGDFDVQLIVYNGTDSDTLDLPQYIHVAQGPSNPTITQTGDTLTSSPAYAYQWSYQGVDISGETNRKYLATMSGPYSVTITDANGCTADTSGYFSLVGIPRIEIGNSISVFPNPLNDYLTIISKKSSLEHVQFVLMNSLGEAILEKTIPGQTQIMLDTKNIPAGIYFLSAESTDFKTTVKLVKY